MHEHSAATLEFAAGKINTLRTENEDLRTELIRTESEMRYLKLQQHYLDIQSSKKLDPASKKQLLKDIEQWKRDWRKNFARQKEDRRSRGFVADDYDDDAASSYSADSTAIRKLIISRHSSVSFSAETGEMKQNGTPTVEIIEENLDETAEEAELENEEEKDVEVEKVVEKTPWQELWDGLADFAGIREDLED